MTKGPVRREFLPLRGLALSGPAAAGAAVAGAITGAVLGALLILSSCASPLVPDGCAPGLPALPRAWEGILPEPDWHLVWVGKGGRVESADLPAGGPVPELGFDGNRAAMVLAWPSWPRLGIGRGMMRPAGAIFPWDAGGGVLKLSWEAGPAAWLYFLMASRSPGGGKIPPKNRAWNFNWPRFRALLAGDSVSGAIRADPWLADWQTVARKTLESGFDARRIKAGDRTLLEIPAPADGPWIRSSPFAAPLSVSAGETLRLETGSRTETGFQVETLVSPSGMIRCSGGAWLWTPFPRLEDR